MEDRELLELAAKASGFNDLTYCEFWKCMAEFVNDEEGYFDCDTCWNPLRNDGDAFRLAINLHLKIDISLFKIRVETVRGNVVIENIHMKKDHRTDKTRLAIVRAAAEMGKAMQ